MTTSVGVTFNVVIARVKNRRAAYLSRRAETYSSIICPVLVDGPVHGTPHTIYMGAAPHRAVPDTVDRGSGQDVGAQWLLVLTRPPSWPSCRPLARRPPSCLRWILGLSGVEPFVNHADRYRSLADGRGDALDRSAAYVAGREDAAPAGLEQQHVAAICRASRRRCRSRTNPCTVEGEGCGRAIRVPGAAPMNTNKRPGVDAVNGGRSVVFDDDVRRGCDRRQCTRFGVGEHGSMVLG